MRRSRLALLAVMVAGSTTLAVACGDDEVSSTPTVGDAGSSGRDGKSSPNDDDGDNGDNGDDKSGPDGGDEVSDASDSCVGKFEPPDLNGPGPCGTQDFGEPAAGFGPVNADAGTTYTGTELADGIYDAVDAERASGSNNGSWRETFVVKGNRFTRIRQVDTGSGGGPGAISYRSGTFTYDVSGGEQRIRLTYDCAQTGDTVLDAGEDNLPSDAVVASDCAARYRYGASGIRITLRRR